jgi:hypothetical protein
LFVERRERGRERVKEGAEDWGCGEGDCCCSFLPPYRLEDGAEREEERALFLTQRLSNRMTSKCFLTRERERESGR